MSHCTVVMAQLDTFLDRELSEQEMEEVRRHLEACPECRPLFNFQERLKRLVRVRGGGQHAPPDLRQAVVDGLRRGSKPEAGSRGPG